MPNLFTKRQEMKLQIGDFETNLSLKGQKGQINTSDPVVLMIFNENLNKPADTDKNKKNKN